MNTYYYPLTKEHHHMHHQPSELDRAKELLRAAARFIRKHAPYGEFDYHGPLGIGNGFGLAHDCELAAKNLDHE